MSELELTIDVEPKPDDMQYLEDRIYEYNSRTTGIADEDCRSDPSAAAARWAAQFLRARGLIMLLGREMEHYAVIVREDSLHGAIRGVRLRIGDQL